MNGGGILGDQLQFIRTLLRCCSSYKITEHAKIQMGARGYTDADVRHCIETGDAFDFQTSDWDDKILLKGNTCDGREFYVVVTRTNPPFLITACPFLKEVWEYIDSTFPRRK